MLLLWVQGLWLMMGGAVFVLCTPGQLGVTVMFCRCRVKEGGLPESFCLPPLSQFILQNGGIFGAFNFVIPSSLPDCVFPVCWDEAHSCLPPLRPEEETAFTLLLSKSQWLLLAPRTRKPSVIPQGRTWSPFRVLTSSCLTSILFPCITLSGADWH